MSKILLIGLKRKRSELAVELQECHRTTTRLIDELKAVDSTIRIYDPEFVPEAKTYRRGNKNKYFEHGEAANLIRDYFRENEGPQSTTDIIAHLSSVKGLNFESNKAMYDLFYSSCLRALHRMADRSQLTKLDKDQGIIRWGLD